MYRRLPVNARGHVLTWPRKLRPAAPAIRFEAARAKLFREKRALLERLSKA